MLAAAALAAGCGDDGQGSGPVTYDVVLVVGAADPPSVEVGTDFAEAWTLDCGDDACTLERSPGEPLGDLSTIRLAADGEQFTADVRSGCATVAMELDVDDDVLVGSVARIPGPGCGVVDLTLGFSGSRAE